jgi:heme A synthase
MADYQKITIYSLLLAAILYWIFKDITLSKKKNVRNVKILFVFLLVLGASIVFILYSINASVGFTLTGFTIYFLFSKFYIVS